MGMSLYNMNQLVLRYRPSQKNMNEHKRTSRDPIKQSSCNIAPQFNMFTPCRNAFSGFKSMHTRTPDVFIFGVMSKSGVQLDFTESKLQNISK